MPETFRPTIYGLYSSTFGVNLEEALISDLKYVELNLSKVYSRPIDGKAPSTPFSPSRRDHGVRT